MYHAEKQDVEDFFMKFGPIRDVWVARRPPGFAYVTFEKAEDAENAIREGNDGMIGDEKIRVELARPRVGMHFDSDLKKIVDILVRVHIRDILDTEVTPEVGIATPVVIHVLIPEVVTAIVVTLMSIVMTRVIIIVILVVIAVVLRVAPEG